MKTTRNNMVLDTVGRFACWTLMAVASLVVHPEGLWAQTSDDLNASLRQQIVAVGKRYQDSVVLRWVPSNAAVWRKAQALGYRIERAEITDDRQGAFTMLSANAVLPWSQQQWASYLDANPQLDSAESQVIMVAGAMLEQSNDPLEMPVNNPGDIEAIRAAKERFEMSYNFALMAAERSRVAADGLGLRFVDPTVKPGVAYRYRITIAGSPDPYVVGPAVVDVAATTRRPEDVAQRVTADELDTQVLLKWTSGTGHSMYHVYRTIGKAPFVRLTATPIVTLRNNGDGSDSDGYLDTNLTNYTVYTYRVTGINAFAEEEELAIVNAMPRDRTPPQAPSGVRTQHVGVRDVVVTWELNAPVEGDLGGFFVLRDTAVDATFAPLHQVPLAASVRQYRDTTATLGGRYYYKIMAVDTARNAVWSFPVSVAFADSIPPAAPVLVKGTMDTNGVVRIVVNHPADQDLMGYRMLFANDPEHEFTVRRELFNADSVFNRQDTIVIDTMEVRTLTKAVYYKFIALDYHYNESEMSNMLVVPRPDLIPPVAPVIRDYVVTDSTIVLDIAPSSSRDVKEHAVLRRLFAAAAPQQAAWDTLTKAGRRDSVIVDPSGAMSVTYQYAAIARDSAGLVSALSNVITVTRVDNKVRPAVTNIAATYDSTSKSVRLTWDYIDLPEKHRFVVYRATASSLTSYAVVADQRSRQFVDTKGTARGTIYAVKVECESGAESRLSERAVAR